MTETQLLTMAAALVAAMFGLLATVLGWIGSRAINKLDEVVSAVGAVKDELHDRITAHESKNAEAFQLQDRRISDQFVAHDRRITKIEARCQIQHTEQD
jgi:hypothetical protein